MGRASASKGMADCYILTIEVNPKSQALLDAMVRLAEATGDARKRGAEPALVDASTELLEAVQGALKIAK